MIFILFLFLFNINHYYLCYIRILHFNKLKNVDFFLNTAIFQYMKKKKVNIPFSEIKFFQYI